MTLRISCVCLGNICRSPMAEAVLHDRLRAAGLAGSVLLESAGTGTWHIGEDMDPRARETLERHGYRKEHVARQITAAGVADYDLILAMDRQNLADLQEMAEQRGTADPGGTADPPRDRIRLFRSFDSTVTGPAEVPDPYYGGASGFETVLEMVERAADGVVEHLLSDGGDLG